MKMATTPGAWRAAVVSMPRIRAWAWIERTITAWVWPATFTSSWNRPPPRSSRPSSNRLMLWPMPNSPMSAPRAHADADVG